MCSSDLFAQEKSSLTPREVADLKYVISSVISDDGSKVAYTVVEPADPEKENASMSSKLYLLDVSSGNSIPFVTQGSIRSIAFRPVYGKLTFISKRKGDDASSLYEISLDGGEARKIFEFETSIRGYSWSPDGKKVAFIANEPKEKKKPLLPYQPEVYEENITYSKAYVAEIEKGDAVEIKLKGNFHSIKWSPDGEKLAASISPTPLVDDKYMKQRIHILKSSDFSEISEVKHDAKLGSFVWSPNSDKLAVLAGADINDPTPGRLMLVDIKKGVELNLIPAFRGKFDNICWVDKENIHFIASEGVYTSLGTLTVANNALKRIINKGSMALTQFSVAKNGNMSLIGNTALYPSELHLLLADSTEPKRATVTNPWLSEKEFGRQEVITYKSRDSLELQGILIYPSVEPKKKKPPLLVVVHGGPESHYNNSWVTAYSRPGQMAATDGYMVFYPNYRGSTGKGVKFAKSSQGDPAGKEFDDIIDGIDYLIDKGLVDENKVGVTGGSYGGYATAWFATRYSKRFVAGVMFVGISNTLSAWGTGDIPNELYYVHFRKRVWEDYDLFLKRSPVYYVDSAKTPLLIMAGKEDPRVDPGQSYELYRHIKTRTATPVRLVLYPGEGHGNRNATARFDYSLRMMRWFDTYLMNKEKEMPINEIKDWRK